KVNDSTSLTDSFTTDDLKGISVFFAVNALTGGSYGFQIKSFCPLYAPAVAGFQLPITPMFHLDYKAFQKRINLGEQLLIELFTHYALLRTINPGYYNGPGIFGDEE